MANDNLLQNTKKAIRAILISSPKSNITVQQLNKEYFAQEGCSIPFSKLGYERLDFFLRSLTDTINLNGSGAFLYVTPIVPKTTQHLTQMIANQRVSQSKRNQRHHKSHNMYRDNYNNRPFLHNKPQSYNNNQRNNFNMPQQQTNYSSSTSSISIASGRSFIRKPLPDSYYHSSTKSPIKINENNENNFADSSIVDSESSSSTIDNSISSKDTDIVSFSCQKNIKELIDKKKIEDVNSSVENWNLSVENKYESKIGSTIFPELMKKGALFEIFVTEIACPSRFWFNFRSDCVALDSMMTEIDSYYGFLNNIELMINKQDVKKGQACAVIYYNKWHRGEIINNIIINQKVKVYLVDYGTTIDVELNNIKYLLEKFCTLSRKAINGSLFGLKPKHKYWLKDSAYAMLEMVEDLCLYCKVIEIDETEQIISMLLYDSNDPENIKLLNDQLIINNYASAIQLNQ